MSSGNNLLDFGIAINFFGNYHKEANAVEQLAERINHSLTHLKHLVIGGSIAYAFKSMGSALFHTAGELEKVYAKLLTVFASKGRVKEHFQHAREFVAENPYMNLEQVHEGTAQLAMNGLAKTSKQANKNLKYLGDFAAGKGFELNEAISMAVNASNGNWQMLQNRGIRQNNLKEIAGNAHGTVVDDAGKTQQKSVVLMQLAKTLEKAKQGTSEYTEALIKYLGVLEGGGMANASKTIHGSLSAINNMFTIFKLEIVGATQELGTLSNRVGTMLNGVAGVFQSKIHEIERIGNGLGRFIGDIFDMFTGQVKGATGAIAGYIDKLAKFFSDYEKNVAPIILFLALIKIQVEEFIKGFWEGFKSGFSPFLTAAMAVWMAIGKIAEWLGIGHTKAESLGKMIGWIIGLLVGLQAFKMITSPLVGFYNNASSLFTKLASITSLISVGEGWSLKDSIGFRWLAFKEKLSGIWDTTKSLAGSMKEGLGSALSTVAGAAQKAGAWIMTSLFPALGSAITATWAWTVALLANPLTWIVLGIMAVIAGVVLLIMNWDKVKTFFIGLWGRIKEIFSSAWAWVKNMFLNYTPYGLIIKHWDKIVEFFSNLWTGVKETFINAWNAIGDWVMAKITSIIDWFKGAWSSIKSAFGFGEDDEATITVKGDGTGGKAMVTNNDAYKNPAVTTNTGGLAPLAAGQTQTLNFYGGVNLPQVKDHKDFVAETQNIANRAGK